jgi:DNA-binding LacI/PurR family transcriptional regulator
MTSIKATIRALRESSPSHAETKKKVFAIVKSLESHSKEFRDSYEGYIDAVAEHEGATGPEKKKLEKEAEEIKAEVMDWFEEMKNSVEILEKYLR